MQVQERDRGQAAVVLVVVVAVLMVVMTMALASVGGGALDRTRAQTAADAAALAALGGGRPAANAIAADHGAVITAWSVGSSGAGDVVTVTVRLGEAWASARATDAVGD